MLNMDFMQCSSGKTNSSSKTFVPKELKNCDQVWVRVDRVRKTLEAWCTGPFEVVKRTPKYFVFQMSDDVKNTVSIDRLKPVHLPPVATAPTLPKLETKSAINPEQIKTRISPKMTVTTESDPEDSASGAVAVNTSAPKATRSGQHVAWKRQNAYINY
jgi:hypothetical protein